MMLFSVLSKVSLVSAIQVALLGRLGVAIPVDPPSTPASDPPAASGPQVVDLGYAVYNGTYNSATGLNTWKGIRYAAPPIGALRWQAPQWPAENRAVVQADAFGPICPQGYPAVPNPPFSPGNEDCLFLNVFAPKNHTSLLPVLILIHGGGYGFGDGTADPTAFITANNNKFLVVTIQYRLGAFGFLSSSEVKEKGLLNAGLLDQQFAMEWVQKNIAKFGGDANRVTIAGESAGGGSVMLHAMAANGTLGTKYWRNGIASSPYDPGQHRYDSAIPTAHFYNFSKRAGCGSSGAVFDCLVGKDTLTLQYANANESINGPYASWAFLPVTDGKFLVDLPSTQLNEKRVNGERLLIGNNAEEGSLFVPPTINTEADLIAWLKAGFPSLSDAQIQSVLQANPSSSGPVDPNATKQETNGLGGPSVVNVSQLATGQQQRGYNIYAEAIFVCPSYWMANAFTGPKQAYHYQYSVPFASHGTDMSAFQGSPTPNQGPDLILAMRNIWGNFIVGDNPSISNTVANGARSRNSSAAHPASSWPVWTTSNPMMLNLNQTGGVPSKTSITGGDVVQSYDPGLVNDITLVNAYSWESGRGQRCDFWKSLGRIIDE